MIFLESNTLRAEFSAKGAELQRLQNKTTGLDYLWKGDPAYWAKYSPILFPIVGGLKDNRYIFEGKEYSLSRHGFARDMEFAYTQPANDELIFTLKDSAETSLIYPFKFELAVHYKLTEEQLNCTYRVTNSDDRNLLFSLGAHPAFAVPLTADTTYEDYFLLFDDDEELSFFKIEQNLISDQKVSVQLSDKILPLKHDLFKDDALVFKTLKSKKISLKNVHNSHGIEFNFSGFPFFGIWAAPGADFVCLEPWCGIADGIHHNKQLSDKEGIESLSPGLQWERTWSVSPF